MLTPKKLTRAENRVIYHTKLVERELRFLTWAFDYLLDCPHVPRYVAEWRGVMRLVSSKYRARVGPEDSLRLCYEALRKSVLRNRHRRPGYVYKACENRHRDFVRQARRTLPLPDVHDQAVVMDWAGVDLALDLEGAGLSPDELLICRQRVLEQRSYHEIAAGLGTYRMEAMRRFKKALGKLTGVFADYGVEESSEPGGGRSRPRVA
jgi:DNA-directed RNA polymerase specialized sigma24 family protein